MIPTLCSFSQIIDNSDVFGNQRNYSNWITPKFLIFIDALSLFLPHECTDPSHNNGIENDEKVDHQTGLTNEEDKHTFSLQHKNFIEWTGFQNVLQIREDQLLKLTIEI